mgnify:CR=1 FL=1
MVLTKRALGKGEIEDSYHAYWNIGTEKLLMYTRRDEMDINPKRKLIIPFNDIRYFRLVSSDGDLDMIIFAKRALDVFKFCHEVQDYSDETFPESECLPEATSCDAR